MSSSQLTGRDYTATVLLKVCSDIRMAISYTDRELFLYCTAGLECSVWYFGPIKILFIHRLQTLWTARRGPAMDEIIPSQSCAASGNWPVYVSTTRTQDRNSPVQDFALYWARWSFLRMCSWRVIPLEVMASAFTIIPMTCNCMSINFRLHPDSLSDARNHLEACIWDSPVDDRKLSQTR